MVWCCSTCKPGLCLGRPDLAQPPHASLLCLHSLLLGRWQHSLCESPWKGFRQVMFMSALPSKTVVPKPSSRTAGSAFREGVLAVMVTVHCNISVWGADKPYTLDKVRLVVNGELEKKREMLLLPYIVLRDSHLPLVQRCNIIAGLSFFFHFSIYSLKIHTSVANLDLAGWIHKWLGQQLKCIQ